MYRLMIVDDEYEIRHGLSSYFPWNDIGFDVVKLAENGQEALDYIQVDLVDVILCDIKMPIMTGIELAKSLYMNNIKTKIIFLSGYKDFDYAKEALKYGVKDYIVKPTKYNELVNVFSKLKQELDEANLYSLNLSTNTENSSSLHSLSYNEKIISSIIEHVKQNYKDVTLEDLAEVVHLNPQYLSKFFKEKTGKNISDFVLQTKMEKAKELLSNIEYKTYEVSHMVGYTNPKNFTRTFKKYFGKTPRQYRNNL